MWQENKLIYCETIPLNTVFGILSLIHAVLWVKANWMKQERLSPLDPMMGDRPYLISQTRIRLLGQRQRRRLPHKPMTIPNIISHSYLLCQQHLTLHLCSDTDKNLNTSLSLTRRSCTRHHDLPWHKRHRIMRRTTSQKRRHQRKHRLRRRQRQSQWIRMHNEQL